MLPGREGDDRASVGVSPVRRSDDVARLGGCHLPADLGELRRHDPLVLLESRAWPPEGSIAHAW